MIHVTRSKSILSEVSFTMASISSVKSTLDSNEYQRPDEANIEDKLVTAFDELTSKSLKTRLRACEVIQCLLRENHLTEFILSRSVTIRDTITRCLKRQKGEDLGHVAIIASLVCVSVGSETFDTFSEIVSLISAVLIDHTAQTSIRIECARSLSTCAFITGDDSICIGAMHRLYSIFKASGLKGDKKMPNIDEATSCLHCACLEAWSLLLVALKNIKEQARTAKESRAKVIELLDSSHLDLRQAAGETIAVIHELTVGHDDGMTYREFEELCDKFNSLISESQKSRSKRELKRQRASFREIRNFFEDDLVPNAVVKFGQETLVLNSWLKRCQYNALCDILGAGINNHLAQNKIVRDIFGLGEVVKQTFPQRAKRSKEVSAIMRVVITLLISCNKLTSLFQHQHQHARVIAEKIQTKKMRGLRDKRAVIPD